MEALQQRNLQSAYSWTTLWGALVMAALVGFSRFSYGLLIPGIQNDLGGRYSDYGFLGTLNFIGYMIGTVVMPLLISRFPSGKRLMNRMFCLLMCLFIIGSALSPNLLVLGGWRFFIGVFSGMGTVLVLSLVLDTIKLNQRGIASGFLWGGTCIGVIITGVVAPYAIDPANLEGWRYTWFGMGVCGILALIGFEMVMRKYKAANGGQSKQPAVESKERVNVYHLLFKPQNLLFLVISYFFYGWGYIIYFTYLIPYLVDKGFSPLNSGLVWCAIGFTGLFNSWLGGKAIDRWPSGYTMAASLFAGALSALCALGGNMYFALFGGLVYGLLTFVAPPLMITALIRHHMPPAAYDACFSYVTGIFAIGQIIGPYFAGLLVDRFGLYISILTASAFLTISAILSCVYGAAQRVYAKKEAAGIGQELKA
mgnify:FL=1